MPEKGKKVTVSLPDHLYLWLSDSAEAEYRTVQQQIVFLLARAFDGHSHVEGGASSVSAVDRTAAGPEPAADQPSQRDVSGAVAAASRFALLAKPPDGRVTTIKVHGIDPTQVKSATGMEVLGATLSLDGTGPVFRIDPDLWIPPVEDKYKQMYGRALTPLGQNGEWLYLS